MTTRRITRDRGNNVHIFVVTQGGRGQPNKRRYLLDGVRAPGASPYHDFTLKDLKSLKSSGSAGRASRAATCTKAQSPIYCHAGLRIGAKRRIARALEKLCTPLESPDRTGLLTHTNIDAVEKFTTAIEIETRILFRRGHEAVGAPTTLSHIIRQDP